MEPKYNTSTNLEEVEKMIGYKFNDIILLRQALTDRSYEDIEQEEEEKSCKGTQSYFVAKPGFSSYERLEYVGDSVVNMLMAREDFLLYPDLPPGALTRLRAANVDTEKLARVAIHYRLHDYLRHKKPLLSGQIEEFSKAISDYPLHSNGLIDPPKVLADIVEAIVGAVYIDSTFSMEITWQVVKGLLQPIITPKSLQIHPMTKLYEMCQKNGFKIKVNDLWENTGEIQVLVDGEIAGRGQYQSKKIIALNRAANNAYHQIMRNKFNTKDNANIDD
ncbi:hypothetical protein LIER_39076 [Lithospermum erythrorhizon]|uniref:RNase III domain-containing protein n=1 Tax=Lithospermum erythrorhizon TaxID=34254 RepID=A0AAV3QAZ8_LITER